MTYQECIKLEDLVPKQVWNEIMANYDWKKHHFEEGNMTYQEMAEQVRITKIKADERFNAYKKTVEGMDGCTHHFDEMATEVMNRFEGTILDIVEEVIDDYCYDTPEGDNYNDISNKLVNVVRKKMYGALKPCFEKEETKMSIYESHIYNADYTCHITLDSISGDCNQVPTYKFHGETTDIGKMLSQIKKRGNMPIANRIWQNDGRHTTVEWRDGTKTTVCCEDPEKYTEWGGFCACVTKKLYGSATKAEFELETAKQTTAWPAKRKQLERERIKTIKANRVKREKAIRESKIKEKMEEMRITNEAGHRLAKEYSEKETAVAVEEG